MSAGSPVLELEEVTKRFGPVTAVDRISLALPEGEFFALLGPSGCGKTTLLRIIAGFETPDAGRVLLDGRDVTRLRANRRPVNMMFQSYALFPHMSVWSNVAYGLEMEGLGGEALKRRVGEALAMVRLAELGRRRPHQLSGGERQRVALARALVKRPRVLLLDEPLAALDRKLRAEMQFELKRLQHEVGITFLVVTHDQEEALVMADRIALLRAGRVAQLDTPQGLYERPSSRFAADFVGTMNFFAGRLARVADGVGAVEVEGCGLLLGAAPEAAAHGLAATLAVRPEQVRLRDQPPEEGGERWLDGTVEGLAYLGQDLAAQVRLAGAPTSLVARLGSGSELAGRIRLGGRVWCHWPARAARILLD